ncbi:PLAC8-domain-containing protein [Atractiella rhizophila]|nr:PLAC8-domain-containing protein [Atractiella rhizophila]
MDSKAPLPISAQEQPIEAPPSYEESDDLIVVPGDKKNVEAEPLLAQSEPFAPARGVRGVQPSFRAMMSLSTPRQEGPAPNPLDKAMDTNGQREWNHGLFECTEDCGTCCAATWCTPCVYGRNKSRLDWLNAAGNPHPSGGRCLGTDCGLHALCSFTFGGAAASILQCLVRGRVRERYAIRGHPVTDCLASVFCVPCQLTQESRELEDEEMQLRAQYGGIRIDVSTEEQIA